MLPGREHARINLDEPRYDQSTYIGRVKHFIVITNPLNLFCSGQQLEEAKELVQLYRQRKEPANTSEDQIWRAKHLYDSAYHPDTGEKMIVIGRMSAQVPMNMTITGCMMTFYRTTPAVIFWQWFNQSFNAVVNYTNASTNSPIPAAQLGLSYALATTAATGTGIALKKTVKNLLPLIGRYVPFAAVAAANCINIPCMRSRELSDGIPVFDNDGLKIGDSQKAARKAVAQVLLSRIMLASPVMLFPPLVMDRLERKGILKRYPWISAPLQVGMVGILLLFAVPLCCAIFPQKSSMPVSRLEDELQERISAAGKRTQTVYFNKGL